ncbi:MAG TPA: GNAT family N-acetyltransferase [Flavobacteriales bacterium]|nr:GNAT family N-acetyltransferase [Flavobacteriales bacterium]HRP82499.1 GNAT family N-acetyltransferase [Flavobacteriales bacterium]HRQ85875.1 GNAT family N-acetyltransferase [Flavobacteriales bacterium]
MNTTIRPAEPRDVPRMLELVRELALFERAPDEVTVTEQHMLDAGFGQDPVWFGWVAEGPVDSYSLSVERGGTGGGPDNKQPTPGLRRDDNPILGMAICYTRYSTWKGRYLYLEDIVVTRAARGQGIGERLFRTCMEHAVADGFHGMRWQVLDWNTDAIRFYERFGAEVSAGWLNGDLTEAQLRALAG